jgi:uncharacterized protein (TIGR03437 family)
MGVFSHLAPRPRILMNRCIFTITLTAFCIPSFAQEREKDDHQKERDEWFYSQRSYPRSQIPAGARFNAIAEIKRIDRAVRARHRQSLATAAIDGSLAATLDAATWTSIGPRPTDLNSTYVTAGRVNAIAIDPRDNDVVYIGAAEGGVWKTTDGGINWKPLTDDQASLASGAIAIDPTNPDTVYVGTGEENFAQDSYYGAGILKSTDGGASWTNIVGPFVRTTPTGAVVGIGALAISPADGQILLASCRLGIYRSTDGAANWDQVLSGVGTSVLFDPTDGNIAYAALGNVNGSTLNGVFRSTDGGQTWQQLRGSGSNALPTSNVGRIEIAIAPSTPTTLYAGIQRSPAAANGNLLGIFKTTDGGSTWNNLNAPDICGIVPQCWYDMTIRVHPKNPDVVFAFGSVTMARSLDGGSTWTLLSQTGPNGVEIHVDEHYLAFTNDGTKLYVANDGGVYSTTNITGTRVNWTELNDTLSITQFYPGLSIHPVNANISYGGAQDNGTQRFGGVPSWNNVTCGDGGYTAIDAAVPNVVYAACQDIAIRKSTNGGNNWYQSVYGIDQQDNTQFISPVVIDPSNPQILYFGTYRVWQSVDGAGTWLSASQDLAGGRAANPGQNCIKTIAAASGDSNIVYAGSQNGRVFMTSNALDGPNSSWTDRSSGLPTRTVTKIAVDPIDPATAYVTFSGFASDTGPTGHIFKTSDGGQNWNDISASLADVPVNALVVDPDIPDTLYIGTDAGVMVSTDAGATWSTLGNGLPRVVVSDLVLHRKTRTLRAATHGRSMWDILLPLAAASRQPLIASVTPPSVSAGTGDFTLSVTGSNFAAGTKLRWNGQIRSTNIVDSSHLTAQISAEDVSQTKRVNIDTINSSRGAGVSNSLALIVSGSGPAPSATPAGFVSAANTPGNSLAPGSLASLYGTNLAIVTAAADLGPPLPFALGGTTMTISTSTVPLLFVSPGQINFQVPWFIVSGRTSIPVTLTQGQLSSTTSVIVTPFAPALFTTNQQGTGQAAALINGTAVIVAPVGAFPGSRPAKKGEFVQLYGTGLGYVDRTPSLGSASPSAPPAMTLIKPTVSIGGGDATVLFSGLSPGFVGLYQVNIQIPPTAPSGNAVPVILTIGGVQSNTATIAIQ